MLHAAVVIRNRFHTRDTKEPGSISAHEATNIVAPGSLVRELEKDREESSAKHAPPSELGSSRQVGWLALIETILVLIGVYLHIQYDHWGYVFAGTAASFAVAWIFRKHIPLPPSFGRA